MHLTFQTPKAVESEKTKKLIESSLSMNVKLLAPKVTGTFSSAPITKDGSNSADNSSDNAPLFKLSIDTTSVDTPSVILNSDDLSAADDQSLATKLRLGDPEIERIIMVLSFLIST